MTDQNLVENVITCTRCHSKYHNTKESISKDFGYKRLGGRYKLCVKCRGNTNIKECCVCMKRLNKNNTTNIKCNHGICSSCIKGLEKKNTIYIKCPICRREYIEYEEGSFHPVIMKICFRNNVNSGIIHPMQLFYHVSKKHVFVDPTTDQLAVEAEWLTRMKVLLKLASACYDSDSHDNPMTCYVYRDGDTSFILRAKKPDYEEELMHVGVFYDKARQDAEVIELFLREQFTKFFG